MSAGLRFMLQSDDRVTISTGTLIKAEIESRNITATYELQGATYRIRTFMPLQVRSSGWKNYFLTTHSL